MMTLVNCSNCGKEIKRDHVKRHKRFACSRECQNIIHSREYHRSKPLGDTRSGYRQIEVGGQTVFEHRKIMEDYLDRKLEPYEVVHHKNGAQNDNRIENLEVMTRIEHAIHHKHAVISRKIIFEAFDRIAAGEKSRNVAISLGIHPVSLSRIKTGKARPELRKQWLEDRTETTLKELT